MRKLVLFFGIAANFNFTAQAMDIILSHSNNCMRVVVIVTPYGTEGFCSTNKGAILARIEEFKRGSSYRGGFGEAHVSQMIRQWNQQVPENPIQ